MSQVAAPMSSDPELVVAFEQNEFDIAGLANLSLDDAVIDRAIHELYLFLSNGSEPRRSSRTRLAQVLLAMMTVARDHYAESGHQEYWPYLFDRVEEIATGASGTCEFSNLLCQANQALLGRWFKLGLDEFGIIGSGETEPKNYQLATLGQHLCLRLRTMMNGLLAYLPNRFCPPI